MKWWSNGMNGDVASKNGGFTQRQSRNVSKLRYRWVNTYRHKPMYACMAQYLQDTYIRYGFYLCTNYMTFLDLAM